MSWQIDRKNFITNTHKELVRKKLDKVLHFLLNVVKSLLIKAKTWKLYHSGEVSMNYIITISLYNKEEKEAVLNVLKSFLLKGRRVTIKEVEGSLVNNECEVFL